MTVRFSAHTTYQFDIEESIAMGMDEVYATPFDSRTNERFADVQTILENLKRLREKADRAAERGLAVYPLFLTIMHPEGNFDVHPRFRRQRNLDGSERPGFVCFRDELRQDEMLQALAAAAELGFRRIAIDDDLRDAFCYCDEHLSSFEGFRGRTRGEIQAILDSPLTSAEHEDLRVGWYKSKSEKMLDFARKVETTIHSRNPKCRIGIYTSAKRCQDLSGRRMLEWFDLFHGDEAAAFTRLYGESYFDTGTGIAKSSGWHRYTHAVYPRDVEQRLEMTTVPAFEFRSPGNLLFECQLALLGCGVPLVHWALAVDFDISGLDRHLPGFKKTAEGLLESAPVPGQFTYDLAVYVGQGLGPYMPVSESLVRDPMEFYANLSLVGLPLACTDRIRENMRAVFVSGPVSREDVQNLDEYVKDGGVACLDALSARGYSLYGGEIEIAVQGPVTGHATERGPESSEDIAIGDLAPECVYLLETSRASQMWTGHRSDGSVTGKTCVVVRHGQGHFIFLGYDMGLASRALTRPAWRERVLAMLEYAGVTVPCYWSGDIGVQVNRTGTGHALANHNTSEACGVFHNNGEQCDTTLSSREIKLL